MNRIICDICGTTYPEKASKCPICGYVHTSEVELEESAERQEAVKSARREKGGHFSQSNVRRRNQAAEQERSEQPPDGYEDVYQEEEPAAQSNPFLVSFLVIVIIALLVTTAFIFFRYYLPNNLPSQPTAGNQTEPSQPSGEPSDPSVLSIPCTGLAITDGILRVTLNQPGDKHLVNVLALPSDTTDTLVYTSSDNSVATVNGEGRVTAVAAGEAVITVTCGEQTISCTVICQFPEESAQTT